MGRRRRKVGGQDRCLSAGVGTGPLSPKEVLGFLSFHTCCRWEWVAMGEGSNVEVMWALLMGLARPPAPDMFVLRPPAWPRAQPRSTLQG